MSHRSSPENQATARYQPLSATYPNITTIPQVYHSGFTGIAALRATSHAPVPLKQQVQIEEGYGPPPLSPLCATVCFDRNDPKVDCAGGWTGIVGVTTVLRGPRFCLVVGVDEGVGFAPVAVIPPPSGSVTKIQLRLLLVRSYGLSLIRSISLSTAYLKRNGSLVSAIPRKPQSFIGVIREYRRSTLFPGVYLGLIGTKFEYVLRRKSPASEINEDILFNKNTNIACAIASFTAQV